MEEGDIIHVDYDLYNGETGDLIETTREATAQEHEMHDENLLFFATRMWRFPDIKNG